MQTLDEPTVGGNEMVALLQALTALKKGAATSGCRRTGPASPARWPTPSTRWSS